MYIVLTQGGFGAPSRPAERQAPPRITVGGNPLLH